MRSWRILLLAGVAAVWSYAQSSTSCGPPYSCIGAGSPNSSVQDTFISAYLRNGFNNFVTGPSGNVAKFGSTGLIQTFTGAGGTGTLALIKPDTTAANNVAQVQTRMYAYYSTVSVATAGYPLGDAQNCPTAGCTFQLFSNRYALFVYPLPVAGGQNFAVRDPFFTKWGPPNGALGLGSPVSAETSVTSSTGSQATVQSFTAGAIYNITSGVISGRLLAVVEPFYDVYLAKGGATGSLGFPTADSLVLPNGNRQQTFEGGALEYDPSTGSVFLPAAVGSVVLTPPGPIQLNVGDTLGVQAAVYAPDGSAITDRLVTWKTSNPAVAVQANGFSATLTAAAAGIASVTATAGNISATVVISVTSVCCQVGEGAPTTALQTAFQAAADRNGISGQVRGVSAVNRVGKGYVQQLLGSGATQASYLIALPDGSADAYVVAGAILAQYAALGGVAGTLGYPISDVTAGGRQNFQRGAIAGNPTQVVSGAILSKWASLSYETGAAGSPTSAVSTFQTFRGTAGSLQSFQSGMIVASEIGLLAGKAFFVTGPVLDAYNSNGGAGGDLGAPTDDVHVVNALNQQDFEGGAIRFANGATRATVVKNTRQPIVFATPSTVIAGAAVHLVAGGFNNGASVTVSQTGQPDFLVTVPTGFYAWDVWIPATAPSSVITVSATDAKSGATAKTTYTVRALSSAVLTLKVVSGDEQTGAPGAQLSQPIVVMLQDSSGKPVAGRTVTFTASPGARIFPATATTDADGRASATLRLPPSVGIALGSAEAGHDVVTFGARSVGVDAPNFPDVSQAIDLPLGNGKTSIRRDGALLTAAASILRYYQTLGLLPQPNGLADPVVLNQFLKSFCSTDDQGNQICDGFLPMGAGQIVNLWRLSAFAGNSVDVSVEATNAGNIRDLVAGGSPLLLALSLNGLGSHFVVATGIASDGSVLISDPNPIFGQSSLSGYLNGFTITDGTGSPVAVKGTVTGVVRLRPQVPSPTAFLAAATAPVAISSAAGACGRTLQFPDTAAADGSSPGRAVGTLYFQSCNGSNNTYALDVAASAPFSGFFTDLTAGKGRTVSLSGSGATSWEVIRGDSQWSLAPVSVSFDAGAVVNAANAGSAIAPGELISISGTGLSSAAVQINGRNAPVITVAPFHLYVQVPFGTATGPAQIRVGTPNGTAQQTISISDVGPAIFTVNAGQAAIRNQDNSVNTTSNPASRGSSISIYGTGLGEAAGSDAQSLVRTPVSVVINGIEIPATAGLSSSASWMYQVTVPVPSSLPPGLTVPLFLKQGKATSNTVTVAIQ